MNSKILYHASTVKIDNFYIPYGGLHLGGKHSALEAALRKLRSPRNVVNADTIYLHKVQVDLGTMHCTDDLGGDDSWREIIEESKTFGFHSVQYKNEYEPDEIPSYMIWDASRVRIIEVDVMHMDEAEEIVEDYLDSINAINILGAVI